MTYPTRGQLAMTHAACTAMAGLAIQAIKAQIQTLREFAILCYYELSLERMFTRDKLREHSQLLSRLMILMNSYGMREKPNGESIFNQFVAHLPRKNLQAYWRNIKSIQRVLHKISADMGTLIMQAPLKHEKDQAEEIRALLEQLLPDLRRIQVKFDEITPCLESILEKLYDDWDKDLEEVADKCSKR